MLNLRAYAPQFLPAIVELWNRSLTVSHGFFPLTETIFQNHVTAAPNFVADRFRLGFFRGELAGFAHCDVVDVAPYPRAGVISALIVAPEFRGRGCGQILLADALANLTAGEKITLIDAGGAWPYSSFYVGLIDGSERAGIAEANFAARHLFRKHGLAEIRESLIMRANLSSENISPPVASRDIYHASRAGFATWLDFAFRFWAAFDWQRIQSDAAISQAIYARMRGYADYCGQEIYAIYGVHTPAEFRGRGFAKQNLAALKTYLAGHGAQILELQVYADNVPARRLYQALGFAAVGKTLITRRQ